MESQSDVMADRSNEMVSFCSEMDIISSEIRVLVPEMNVLLFFSSHCLVAYWLSDENNFGFMNYYL